MPQASHGIKFYTQGKFKRKKSEEVTLLKSIPKVVPYEKGESYPKLGIGELMQKKSDKLLTGLFRVMS